MQEQNYKNHRQYVMGFHAVLFAIIFLSLIGSVVNLIKSWCNHEVLYSASLIVMGWVAAALLFYYARSFALRAQDRAIRAEENLRHFAMTGKLLDPRLAVRQIIGLRFASDEEFILLANRAAEEKLSEDDIKKAVKNWRPDHYRV